MKYLDVTRTVDTNLDAASENMMFDYWNMPFQTTSSEVPQTLERKLSEEWTGRTFFRFDHQRHQNGNGYWAACGRQLYGQTCAAVCRGNKNKKSTDGQQNKLGYFKHDMLREIQKFLSTITNTLDLSVRFDKLCRLGYAASGYGLCRIRS